MPGAERDAAAAAAELPAVLQARLDAWLADAVARQAPLTFRDLRRGVQALSARYVERRSPRGVERDAFQSPARRGAFATYYAALHLMTAGLAAPEAWRGAVRRVVDLGAGSGAAGAGAALVWEAPELLAVDRSGWALGEARRACASLGVPLRTRRAELPAGVPRARPGDAFVLGWVLNECAPGPREATVARLARALDAGARLLLLEPLAGAAAPFWDALTARLGLRAELRRWRVPLPAWLAEMDRAAGLDHRELGARVAWGPA